MRDDKGRQFTKSCYKKFMKTSRRKWACLTLTPESCATYATYNHTSGVEDKTFASLMGCADCKTAMNVHTLVDMKRYNGAYDSMGGFLSGKSS